ncbi:hypothetical protein AGDE_11784 [Angomonas deanei]|nr:hypothetical protein AGDE_11784 [Angomonas deanei]|eukprot:EPY25423.1 hypothetical protein AGDE_11784 [Angomonas deanei]
MVSFWLLLYSSVALLASDTRLSAKDAPRKDSDPDAAVSSTFVAREEGSSKDRKRIPLPAVGWLDHAAEEMALQCKTEDNRAYVRAARQLAPHSTSRILVLGMGGNSMAVALRLLLGPHAEIHVVEIDASVFRACKAADTLLESDTKQFVYVESAEKCLPRFVNNYFHFIFMDLFEPLDATMVMTSSLVGQCHAKLSFGGMLVVNDHQLPSPATVTPWVELFGDGNVSLVNLNGWKESVLVCMKEGDAKKDGKMLQCNRIFLDKIYSGVYDRLTPGLLPPPGWIKKALKMSSTNKAKSAQCFES